MNTKILKSLLLALAAGTFTVGQVVAQDETPTEPVRAREKLRSLQDDIQEGRMTLRDAWLAIRAELGVDATAEEIQAAREKFEDDYAEQIAAQKELALELRERFRSRYADNRVDKGEVPDAVREIRQETRELKQTLKQEREQLVASLKDATPEERQAAMKQFREESKQQFSDLKEKRREAIEQLRNGQNGDQRAED